MGLGDEREYFCTVFNFDDYIDYIGFYSHRNHTASRLNKKPFRLPERFFDIVVHKIFCFLISHKDTENTENMKKC